MSFAEIKQSISALTAEQRLELAALITHLNRADDVEWQQELDKRLDAMERGRKHSVADLEKAHHN